MQTRIHLLTFIIAAMLVLAGGYASGRPARMIINLTRYEAASILPELGELADLSK